MAKIPIELTRDQIVALIRQVSPPSVYDAKCPLCGAEFILLPDEGFIMEPACGPQCAAQILREAYARALVATSTDDMTDLEENDA